MSDKSFIERKREIDALSDYLKKTEKAEKVPQEVYDLVSRLNRNLYTEWDYDRSHIGQCEDCPRNMEMEGHNFPCGQQHCWVDVTCNPKKYSLW